MSYWIYLRDDDGTVQVPTHTEGGTYAVGGTAEAEMNLTYNYTRCYVDAGGESPRAMLHEHTGAETLPILRHLVSRLGTERDDDYWAATPGNAGYAASVLLRWAEAHPDARWHVS